MKHDILKIHFYCFLDFTFKFMKIKIKKNNRKTNF